jgi:hypothetical protein
VTRIPPPPKYGTAMPNVGHATLPAIAGGNRKN